ncbi:MAG: ribulose-phosphate 3-epimerase [Lachnospiraceae bacterium]|nr:ribulose-phosphate 3-epimerase [Lachnospiraceae bacterium]
MSELAPSILSADFNRLGEQLKLIKDEGIKIVHVDVMDGMFVPSISFGMPVIKSIRKESDLEFDVHLMIQKPERYIKEFYESGADNLLIHYEACDKLDKTLNKIKDYGMKAGLVINPETKVCDIMQYLGLVDIVLVMTVHPGFGGQSMLENCLDKVNELAIYRDTHALGYRIEIDGGVNKENIKTAVDAGTDVVVAGTAVFSGDIKTNVEELKALVS